MEDNNNSDYIETKKAPLASLHPAVLIMISLITVFITYQFFGGLIEFVFVGEDFSESVKKLTITRIILSFSQLMFILVPVILINELSGKKFTETFLVNKPSIPVFLLSITGIIIVQPFIQFYMYIQNNLIFSAPFLSDSIKQIKEVFDKLEIYTFKIVSSYSVSEFIFVTFIIAVIPAVCEEFFFRGLIFKNFERYLKHGKAILYTGVLFAVFHFNPFNIIPLILLGVYLTYVVYASKSIYTAIMCHFINNFISTVSVFIYGRDIIGDSFVNDSTIAGFIIAGILSLLAFIVIIVIINRIISRRV